MQVSIPVEWSETGKVTRCRSIVEELAGGGVFVRTSVPPAAGAAIDLELHTDEGAVLASGIVAWARPGRGMGIAIPESLEELFG